MTFDFINDQETSTTSNTGAKMVYKDVATGKPMLVKMKGDKAPRECFLMLLGPENAITRAALIESAKRENSRDTNQKITEAQRLQMIAEDASMLSKLVVGGELPLNGKWTKMDSENSVPVFEQVFSLRRQVTGFVIDLGNYKKPA